MGYSRNIQTLIDRLKWLGELQQGRACHWDLGENSDPQKFAYKVREALHVAKLFREAYPALAEAADNFTIEVIGPRQVQARRKKGVTDVQVLTGEARPVSGLETLGKHEAPQLVGAAAVIEHVIRQQPSNDKHNFPMVSLTNEDLVRIWRWCQSQTPKWLMFVAGNGALTITRWTRDMADLSWSPADIGMAEAVQPERVAPEEDEGRIVLSRPNPVRKPVRVDPDREEEGLD